MKQTKWLVNLSACLVLMAVSAVGAKGKLAGPRGAREQGGLDTIPLPSRIYSIGKEVDSIQSPSSLQPFFAGLDSLRGGEGYRIDDRPFRRFPHTGRLLFR